MHKNNVFLKSQRTLHIQFQVNGLVNYVLRIENRVKIVRKKSDIYLFPESWKSMILQTIFFLKGKENHSYCLMTNASDGFKMFVVLSLCIYQVHISNLLILKSNNYERKKSKARSKIMKKNGTVMNIFILNSDSNIKKKEEKFNFFVRDGSV